MRILIFLLLGLICYSVCAQKSIFVRVYDSIGNKIYKGNVYTVTDSSLLLIGRTAPVDIPVSKISYIRTKHSELNNVLIGSITGLVFGTLIGAASGGNPDEWLEPLGHSVGDGAASGAIVGTFVGGGIGALTIPFKNSKTFLVNGDPVKWKEFEIFISQKTGEKK